MDIEIYKMTSIANGIQYKLIIHEDGSLQWFNMRDNRFVDKADISTVTKQYTIDQLYTKVFESD